MRKLAVLSMALLLLGCSRAFYRQDADVQTYAAVDERLNDPRWLLPPASIQPPVQSRLHDPFDPDHPPLPPDDPAAHQYMISANGMRGYKHWHKDGDAPWIESPQWRDFLQLTDDGTLVLTPDRSVELGLLHSREYQTQMENVYLVALALTLNRFEFDLHWFFRNNTIYTHDGNSSFPFESNTLATNTNFGFTKAFAAGGQLLVDFANSFVWEYNGPNQQTVSSNLLVNLIQPLLRGAGRDVRMEDLTQGERSLLYAVREFARFRKQFYVDITTQGGYLDLLLQLQSIRNFEANLKSQEQNLRMHEALYAAGSVSGLSLDQAFQGYQGARLALLQAQTGLENAFDAFKITLGLPPGIPIRLDDALLNPFQLNAPELTGLQEEAEKLLAEYRQLDAPPPLAKLKDAFNRLKEFNTRAEKIEKMIREELARWKQALGDIDPKRADDPEIARQRSQHKSLERYLTEMGKDLAELGKTLDKTGAALAEDKRAEGLQDLLKQARLQNDLMAQLFVVQTQVRVFLIKLKPIPYELGAATRYALANRLDLMNRRGQVVDAWRQIAVTANALEADLNVVATANIGTEADASNPFDLRARASSYSVGVQFDGPLNRQQERNVYRASLINYQRSRRVFMAQEDAIVQSIRDDLRQLETQRLNFEIARQSLVVAARQVEDARGRLLQAEKGQDTVTTRNVLDALNNLLAANNTLIGSWINFESGRIQLLLDMEALQVDERGMYSDEHQLRIQDLFGPGAGPGDCADQGQPVAQPVAQPIEPGRP